MADSAPKIPPPAVITPKVAPPPPALPVLGKAEPAQTSFIGRTNYVVPGEEKKFIFGIKRDDRRHHLYIIGKNGVGKSKLMELLIRQDIGAGEGVCLLDQNGGLIDALLDFIPEKRVGDVVMLSPTHERIGDFEQLMRERKIILVNLAAGKLGEEKAGAFGSQILENIRNAGMARAHLPSRQRKEFYLYLDGCSVTDEKLLENLLAQSREYGISLTLGHQYLAQVSDSARAAIFGGVGNFIIFRISGPDAQTLEPELAPVFKAKDMVSLGKREFYIKLLIDGEHNDPFSAETLAVLPATHPSYREKIVALSHIISGK